MTSYVPSPDGQQVAAFLGRSTDAELIALAGEHVGIVVAMARSYTRDSGFDDLGDPADDVAAVIVTATARLVVNPSGARSKSAGPFSEEYGAPFTGWSLAESFVLNRYRKRAA